MKKLLLIFSVFLYFNAFSNDYFILSIDGGGSRGVIPVAFLKNLEEDIGGNCAIAFNCISGTSTGSIIASGLAIPDPNNLNKPKYRASEILSLYLDEIPKVFEPSIYYHIKTLWGLIGPKYEKNYLEQLIYETCKDFKIKDALTDLIIPSFDLVSEKGFYFEHFKNLNNSLNDEFNVTQADLASTSAPIYFSPEIFKINDKQLALIDGGVLANDPAVLTIRECIKNMDLQNTHIYVLSLSCGNESVDKIDVDKIEKWGLIRFLPEIIDTLFDGMLLNTDEDIECLKKILNLSYIRFDMKLTPEESKLDITDKNILYKLIEKAEKFYNEHFINSDEGKKLIELLRKKVLFKNI